MVEIRPKSTRQNPVDMSAHGYHRRLVKTKIGLVLKTNGHLIKPVGEPPYKVINVQEAQKIVQKHSTKMSEAGRKAWQTRRAKQH